jgi:hypothetical protein
MTDNACAYRYSLSQAVDQLGAKTPFDWHIHSL